MSVFGTFTVDAKSSTSSASPQAQTPTSTQTFSTNHSTAQMNLVAWNGIMSRTQTPKSGCFSATYPSVGWVSTKCVAAPNVPLLPQPLAPLTPVGDGNDYSAQSPSTLIGSSSGSFPSISGLTSETDSDGATNCGFTNGANCYSLQINSNPFTTSTTDTGSHSTTGWQQFIFLNDPGATPSSSGFIYIQYWLFGYLNSYSNCPPPSDGPPGGSSWMTPTPNPTNSCYANSFADNSPPSVPFEQASNLANLVLKGYVNYSSCNGGSCDETVICISGSCYAMAITDTVLNLYLQWYDSEFNIFGFCCGSEANFNSGTTISVQNLLFDKSGNAIAPSCVKTSTLGIYTAETNNLNLSPWCLPVDGQITFAESNTPNTVTFNTNPSSFLGASSPGSIGACGGTFTNGQASTNCDSGFSATANLPSPSSQWQFNHWERGGGVACSSNIANPTSCTVTYAASLNAVYAAQITFQTNPSTQGSISWASCSNTGYTNGQTLFNALLPPEFSNSFTVCANIPSGYVFSGWSTTGGLSVDSSSNPTPTATFTGPGTITANFNLLVTATQTSTTTSITSTQTSTTSTQRTTTTTTTSSTSTSTVGQLCYITSTSSTTNVIIQAATVTTSTSSTQTITTATTSTFQTTTFQTSTSTSTSLTTTSVTVCTQTSTTTTTFTGTSTFTRPSTTISLLLNPSSVSLGSPVTLSGSIVQNPGAVQVTVSFSLDLGSTWTTLMLLMTDSSGSYSTSWIPPYPENYLLKASWNGNGQLAGSASSTASLTVAGIITPSPTLLLTAPSTASRGQVVSLSIIVFNPSSSGLKANVAIEITGPGNYLTFDVIQVNVASSSQSTGYFDWTVPNSSGMYTVTVGLLPPKPAAFDAATIQIT